VNYNCIQLQYCYQDLSYTIYHYDHVINLVNFFRARDHESASVRESAHVNDRDDHAHFIQNEESS
jgi:hypothetical protein